MFFTGAPDSIQSMEPFQDGAHLDSMISGEPFTYAGENFPAEEDYFSHEFASEFTQFSQEEINSLLAEDLSLGTLTAPTEGLPEMSWVDPSPEVTTTPVAMQGELSHLSPALPSSSAPTNEVQSHLMPQSAPFMEPMNGVPSYPTPVPAPVGASVGHGVPIYHPPAPTFPTVPQACSMGGFPLGHNQPLQSPRSPFLRDQLVNPYRMDFRSRAIRFLGEYPSADQGFQGRPSQHPEFASELTATDTESDVMKVIELAHQAGFFELERGYSGRPLSELPYEPGVEGPFAMVVRYARCPLIDPKAWIDCEEHVKEILVSKLNSQGEMILKELDMKCVERSGVAQGTCGYIQAVRYAQQSDQEKERWTFEEMRRCGIVEWLVKNNVFL